MTADEVIAFLRCPASAIVNIAIEMANLTWKEQIAIELCGRQSKTQDKAAEETGYSVDSMQRWYRAGITKLIKAWSGIWWIKKVIV